MGANGPRGVTSLGPRSLIGRIYVGGHYKSMGAIYGHGGHLDLRTMTICIYFQFSFNTRLHIRFEEIWPRGFRVEVVQMSDWKDRRKDGRRTAEGE